MTRIVDVHLNEDGSAVVDGLDRYSGPTSKDALRLAMDDICKDAQTNGEDRIVHVTRPDGGVMTINALRDGTIHNPTTQAHTTATATSESRTAVRPSITAAWKAQRTTRFAAVAAVAVIIAGGGVAFALSGEPDRPVAAEWTAPAVPDITRPAPPGWTRQVAWEVGLGQSGPAIGAGLVVVMGPDGILRAFSADTGAALWKTEPLDGVGENTPIIGRSGEHTFVAIKSTSSIALIPLNALGSAVAPIGVPTSTSAQLTTHGEGVLVVEDGVPPRVLAADGTLRSVDVPAAHVAFEALGDGTVVAAAAEGGWTLLPAAGAPTPITPAAPEGATGPAHVGASTRGVVVAWWNTADPTTRIVSFHDARTGAVTASASVPAATVDAGFPSAASEDGTLVSAGPIVVNRETGDATYLDGWLPSNAADGNVFGTVNDERAVWTVESGVATPLGDGAAVPWSVSDSGLAIVLDQQGDRMRLAAIQPTASTDAN